MEQIYYMIGSLVLVVVFSYGIIRYMRYGFFVMLFCLTAASFMQYQILEVQFFLKATHYMILPSLFCILLLYVYVDKEHITTNINKKYRLVINTNHTKLVLDNIRRGFSIIGSAGSGKTESVVYNLLQHFARYKFCGIIHDYKNFELTEIACSLFKKGSHPFYVISFDPIYHKVNPIAPRYMKDEEDVNEISRVLLENLLELKESNSSGNSRFFNDTAEGLITGIILRLKIDYQDYCTIPHMIALYQHLSTKALVTFLSANLTSKGMADAFIGGADSSRQTAGVKSTLANAFKKISSKKIFMVLSADETPLNINNAQNLAIISIVNNPKKETSLSPVIATIMHTVVKQMSERHQNPSFILMEEAPTIRLLNMHRIPATLRSYDIVTVYVMQDKIQNDMLYGDKGSKAILSNLSYQFFGKVNDPDTAKYYERFFELIKMKTTSINKGHNLNFDTRVTSGEKEVSKVRADIFFRLKPGEFISFADGKDRKVQFKHQTIRKSRHEKSKQYNDAELQLNFERIHKEIQSLFGN